MSSEASELSAPEGEWAERARAFHALAAVVAALAFVGLFAWKWHRGQALRNPLPAMLIALSLAVGAGSARTIALRLERVRGSRVSALLRIANAAEMEEQDGIDESPGRRRSHLMLNAMSLQIAATGVAGVVALVVLVLFDGPSTLAGVDAWPGVASIVLLEGMYIAWLAEGQAAADELILVIRRWVRSGEPGGPSPVVGQRPSTESLAASSETVTRDRAHQIWEKEGRPEGKSEEYWSMAEAELAAEKAETTSEIARQSGRARFLRDVLVRYGVELNGSGLRRTGV